MTDEFEILIRNDARIADVDKRQRIIDIVVVPWDEEGDVVWRGENWRETFQRGAYDGIQEHAGRIRVNREHVKGDTVGRAASLDPSAAEGLIGRLKIATTLRGDDTLELAADDALSASPGYYVKKPSDVVLNRRQMTRRVVRAFLDHIGLVESPTFAGARVLAVRAEQSGLMVAESPLPPTPALDEVMNDPLFAWAAERLAAIE